MSEERRSEESERQERVREMRRRMMNCPIDELMGRYIEVPAVDDHVHTYCLPCAANLVELDQGKVLMFLEDVPPLPPGALHSDEKRCCLCMRCKHEVDAFRQDIILAAVRHFSQRDLYRLVERVMPLFRRFERDDEGRFGGERGVLASEPGLNFGLVLIRAVGGGVVAAWREPFHRWAMLYRLDADYLQGIALRYGNTLGLIEQGVLNLCPTCGASDAEPNEHCFDEEGCNLIRQSL